MPLKRNKRRRKLSALSINIFFFTKYNLKKIKKFGVLLQKVKHFFLRIWLKQNTE